MIAAQYTAAGQGRTLENLDMHWCFHLRDTAGAEAPSFDDASWRRLSLPHDFSIEQPYARTNPAQNGFLPGGTGWYRRHLSWPGTAAGRHVFIRFDGVYMNSEVWINGHLLGKRPNGYLGFRYEVTPYLKKGDNVVAVRVDNSKVPSARWYTGSGIYRHVWLVSTGQVRVAYSGTFVKTPVVSPSRAEVTMETTVENLGAVAAQAEVSAALTDAAGKVLSRKQLSLRLEPGTSRLRQAFDLNSPHLWSPSAPYLYAVVSTVTVDGRVTDVYRTPLGVRTLRFDPDSGFVLNGVPMKFRGVCDHQDISPVGIAVPEDMLHRRLAMLRQMGCNAIRTSHNPRSPEFYNMCDTMGFLVMDEAFDGWDHAKARWDYGNYWNPWWKRDLEDFIRRDRNHPSVVMWSQGNEVPGFQKELNVQKEIYDVFHQMDSSRPVTQAWALGTYLDVAGFNANGEERGALERFHRQYPSRPAIGTEIPHTRQTRGVYRSLSAYDSWDGPDKWQRGKDSARIARTLFPLPDLSDTEVFKGYDARYASGYDNQTRKISVREEYKQVRRYGFYMGDFRWTGFDYLGESWGWPARTNNYGVIDLAGFPKDDYYLYQSLWTERPMVHLLPHWTHPGMEGTPIPVVVYTNADEVALYLNGKLLGRKPRDTANLQLLWQVPYQPGKILAVAYRSGREVARDSSVTAGAPAGIRLESTRSILHRGARQVAEIECDLVDASGNPVPDAADSVSFRLTGPYRLLGVENGDILDTASNKSLSRRTFMGKALLVVDAAGRDGDIRVRATAPGLRAGTITVKVKR